MSDGEAQALDSLFEVLPDAVRPVDRERRILFLNARWHFSLRDLVGEWVCVSRFRPDALALTRAGIIVHQQSPAGVFDLVMVCPSRQRVRNRAILAQAAASLSADGVLITAASNDAGARSLQGDMQQLMGAVECRSLNRCRVVWSSPRMHGINVALGQQWIEESTARAVENTPLFAAPGMFSWDRIDPGSRLLSEHLPEVIGGRVADFGAGWGYLSAMAMRRCRDIHTLDLYEADLDSLQQAEQNLAALSADQVESRPRIQTHWVDVVDRSELARDYDAVLCNPPFHSGNSADPELGRQFIAQAANVLRPGGRLWLVANRHLPYEGQLRQLFDDVQMLVQSGTYKVFAATRRLT